MLSKNSYYYSSSSSSSIVIIITIIDIVIIIIIVIVLINCFIARCFITDRVTTTRNNVVRHWTLTTGLASLLGFTEFYSNWTRKICNSNSALSSLIYNSVNSRESNKMFSRRQFQVNSQIWGNIIKFMNVCLCPSWSSCPFLSQHSLVDCTQSLPFLVHSNWETGASERHSRSENGEEGRLFPILRAAVYLAHSSLAHGAHLARSSLSITKRKERDCVQSTTLEAGAIHRSAPCMHAVPGCDVRWLAFCSSASKKRCDPGERTRAHLPGARGWCRSQ